MPLQQALRHQYKAFGAFFTRRARYPRFKSRRSRQSAHYTRSAFTMRGGELRLAKTSTPLRYVWSWPDVDVAVLDPAMVIISRESDSRWYVTFTLDTAAPEPLAQTRHAVGVDLGVRDFAATSDGDKIARPAAPGAQGEEPGSLPAAAGPLPAGVGQPGQGCGQGSARTSQGPLRAGRLPAPRQHPPGPRERSNRDRRSQCLRHGPQSASGPGNLRLQPGRCVPAANQRYGRRLVVIDRWYPSSKTCSACGHLLAELSLSIRQWRCPSCGVRHDRDINAAKNILAAGLAVAWEVPGDACGADMRHSGSSRVRSAVKQEPWPARAGIPVLHRGE